MGLMFTKNVRVLDSLRKGLEILEEAEDYVRRHDKNG